jgi:PIN domain
MSEIVFIDSNQYLNLYRLVAGAKLLDAMEEQKAHIFVSMQIVDEVVRNKLRCAENFLSDKIKDVETIKAPVPDHLLGISDEKLAEFRGILRQAEQTRSELTKLVADALSRISRSEDDVSKRLGALFDKAVSPTAEEMQRARERKEKGNPPGKRADPLGDQITWEQLLSHCKESKCSRLWIISSDEDYCIKHGKHLLLNSLLRRDLIEACGTELEINCFGDLLEGIEHFGRHAGVKAEKLPTEEEAAVIRKEIEALPPRGWFPNSPVPFMNYAHALRPFLYMDTDYSNWPPPDGGMPMRRTMSPALADFLSHQTPTPTDSDHPANNVSAEDPPKSEE